MSINVREYQAKNVTFIETLPANSDVAALFRRIADYIDEHHISFNEIIDVTWHEEGENIRPGYYSVELYLVDPGEN